VLKHQLGTAGTILEKDRGFYEIKRIETELVLNIDGWRVDFKEQLEFFCKKSSAGRVAVGHRRMAAPPFSRPGLTVVRSIERSGARKNVQIGRLARGR
jgi:hypothetical protein